MFLIFVLTLTAFTAAIALSIRHLLRWRRSHSLNWPGSLAFQEQARICDKYLRRRGVRTFVPAPEQLLYHLRVAELPNNVLISFSSSQTYLVASYLRDRQQALPSMPVSTVIAIVVAGAINPRVAHWVDGFGIAILEQRELSDLATLLIVKSPNLRAALLEKHII
jgi:hypothetical protein